MSLPVNLENLHQKVPEFNKIIDTREKAFKVFKSLVELWKAEESKSTKIRNARIRSKINSTTVSNSIEWMKTAHVFFNFFYKEMTSEVEKKIKDRKEAELKRDFEREGKPYEEDIIEEEKEYRGGVMFTKQVKKGKRETSDFRKAWEKFYSVNKDAINKSDDDFKKLTYYHSRTNNIYRMYELNDNNEWESSEPRGPGMGGIPKRNTVPCDKCGEWESIKWWKRKNLNIYYCNDCYNEIPDCYRCRIKKVWDRTKKEGDKEFCSQTCLDKWKKETQEKNSWEPETRPQFFTFLSGLSGWELLTEDEKDRFKDMIRLGNSKADWKEAIEKAEKFIAQRRAESGEGDEGVDGDENEGDKIETVRKWAISQIENALQQEPPISEDQLNRSNWRNDIQNSPLPGEIRQILVEVLADIKLLRGRLVSDTELENLISQAQTAASQQDWPKLKGLLQKIGLFQDQPHYENQREVINQLNQQLATHDLSSYEEMVVNSLENILVQDPPVSVKELKPENRDFAQRIKDATSEAEVNQIKEEVLDDVNTKRSEKVVDNLILESQKITSVETQAQWIEAVYRLKNGNKWEKAAYAAREVDIERVLAAWKRSGTPIQTDLKNEDQPSTNWPKVLGIAALIMVPLAVVSGLIWFKLHQRRRREWKGYI